MLFKGYVLEDVKAVLYLIFLIFSQVVGTDKWWLFIFKQKYTLNVTL